MTPTVKRIALPLGAVALLLITIGWMAGMFTQKIEPGLQPVELPAEADTVSVIEISRPLTEPVAASLTAKQATLISSRILARITRIHVRAGDTVNQGDPLIDLERKDYMSRKAQAAQSVEAISARLREANNTLKRTISLAERGLVATADLDRARANQEALSAELQAAKRRLQEAETALDFTAIKAPIDGRVVDRFAEPGDTASPGIKLLSIYNPLSLRIEANVREELALTLKAGQPLEVEIPSLNQQVTGTIEEVVPAANPGSRSFLVKAALDYDPNYLPGLYARLHIPAGDQQLRLIPSDRIARVGQLDMVWVLTPTAVQSRYIRTGKNIQYEGKEFTEVIAGLKPGEKILPVMH